MTDLHASAPSTAPAIRDLETDDIWVALKKGFADFRRAPALGLVFGGFYFLIGLIVVWSTAASGHTLYALTMMLGFPLVAPFAAVGLYETSRRIERGEPLDWGEIFSVVAAERGRQLPWFGTIAIVWFLLYLIVAHVIFALTMGASAMLNIMSSFDAFFTPAGLAMILLELVAGAAFAFVVFVACVVSLPMLMDRDVDFVTAMVTSFRAVGQNPRPMLLWAVLVVALLAVAMIPLFLGLLVALPVLGHATWHIYRRTVAD